MSAGALATAVMTAVMSQLGVKYVFGGESPGKAFDCSGLVQWAYGTVGIKLPRTSQEQYTATNRIAAAQAQPGDLVFSAGSDGTASAPGHVGVYIGDGQYIDAPFTGAVVRADKVPGNATYGRVPGLTLDATGAAAQAAGNVQASGATGGNGCNAKGKIFGIATLEVTYCEGKAVVGGLLVGSGGVLAIAGVIVVVAWGLGHTGAGKGAMGAAKKLPGVAGLAAAAL